MPALTSRPALHHHALIVAHGSPTDTAPQEAALHALAATVAAHLPGWRVLGATLALPGALESALDRLENPLIYPFFMAEGWFTGRELPRRLALAGAGDARQLPPFGTDAALPALMADVALAAARQAGLAPAATTLLIAAHGSKIARNSADSTHAMVATLAAMTPFLRVCAGFVEQEPFLCDAAKGLTSAKSLTSAICLPFFALRAGHVTDDIPEALAQARFVGPVLPAIGEHPRSAALIAAGLRRGAAG